MHRSLTWCFAASLAVAVWSAAGCATAPPATGPAPVQPAAPEGVKAPDPARVPTGVPPQPPPPPRPTEPAAAPVAVTAASSPVASQGRALPAAYTLREFPVPTGSRPHDVAPAADGGVWWTAQGTGNLGWLDPATGQSVLIPLGRGSAPHGVIVGPDKAAWITDGGLNAIVRVDGTTRVVTTFPLPANRPLANLNTAAFDGRGQLWFTGQNGIYGRLDPASGRMDVWDAPGGRGPYGITGDPAGGIWYVSLAGNHLARVDVESGRVTRLEPATANQGARRVWNDSQGRLWISEWNSGQLSRYDPRSGGWAAWKVPSGRQAYAVYVDDQDAVWVSDWGANAMARFDPRTETWLSVPLPNANSNVRQILGRPGELWLPLSGADKLAVLTPR
jgi:virginiamycin B lyase